MVATLPIAVVIVVLFAVGIYFTNKKTAVLPSTSNNASLVDTWYTQLITQLPSLSSTEQVALKSYLGYWASAGNTSAPSASQVKIALNIK